MESHLREFPGFFFVLGQAIGPGTYRVMWKQREFIRKERLGPELEKDQRLKEWTTRAVTFYKSFTLLLPSRIFVPYGLFLDMP